MVAKINKIKPESLLICFCFYIILELRLDVQFFTHNDGKQENLVTLDGTIPVFYKNRQYNIPIMIWLYEKHPEYAPMVFVKPTSTMVIRQGRHVDTSGKVYLPYLSEWKSRRSDLIGLVGVLCTGKERVIGLGTFLPMRIESMRRYPFKK